MRNKNMLLYIFLSLSVFLFTSASYAFMITPNYDVDKYGNLPTADANGDTTDWYMCWAATLANVLTYTNWAVDYDNDGILDPYDVYQDFLDHYSDFGGSVRYGFEWYISQYYSDLNYMDYFYGDLYNISSMDNLNLRLGLGYGTCIGLFGHVATGWGYEVDPITKEYTHIYLTDSDDIFWGLHGVQKYELAESNGEYYIKNYLGVSGYNSRIYGVTAISQNPFAASPTPEPATMMLFGFGLLGLAKVGRRKLQ